MGENLSTFVSSREDVEKLIHEKDKKIADLKAEFEKLEIQRVQELTSTNLKKEQSIQQMSDEIKKLKARLKEEKAMQSAINYDKDHHYLQYTIESLEQQLKEKDILLKQRDESLAAMTKHKDQEIGGLANKVETLKRQLEKKCDELKKTADLLDGKDKVLKELAKAISENAGLIEQAPDEEYFEVTEIFSILWNAPLVVYHAMRYLNRPVMSGPGIYDPTTILNADQFSNAYKEGWVKLVFYLISFFYYLYALIYTLVAA